MKNTTGATESVPIVGDTQQNVRIAAIALNASTAFVSINIISVTRQLQQSLISTIDRKAVKLGSCVVTTSVTPPPSPFPLHGPLRPPPNCWGARPAKRRAEERGELSRQ